jgi:hypothetical protein
MGKLRTTISLAAVFVVAFAGTAVANHVFNDVPTNNAFHDEISEIGDAGCAEGFPGGLFKPTDPVKRQQMARFLSRCGGRVAFDSAANVNVMGPNGSEHVITDVNFTATADGFVVLNATGTTSLQQETQCPCEVVWQLRDDTHGVYAPVESRGQLDNSASAGGNTFESMATTGVFPISQGETVTYQLRGSWADNDVSGMSFEASMTATFFPFSGEIDL